MKYDKVKDFYNKNFKHYAYNNDKQDTKTLKEFMMRLPGERKVLDVGAGTGVDSHYFQDCYEGSLAFDFSEKMVELGKSGGVKNYVEGEFLAYDFNEKFDGVWCSSSIFSYYDKKDRAKAYNKVYKLLNKDGALGVVYKSDKSKNKKGDVKMFSDKELADELCKTKFNVEAFQTLNYAQNQWVLVFLNK